MGWSKPEKTSWGSYRSTKDGYGSLHSTKKEKGGISHSDHVHFHKDGATIHKSGKSTYTLFKSKRGFSGQ